MSVIFNQHVSGYTMKLQSSNEGGRADLVVVSLLRMLSRFLARKILLLSFVFVTSIMYTKQLVHM